MSFDFRRQAPATVADWTASKSSIVFAAPNKDEAAIPENEYTHHHP